MQAGGGVADAAHAGVLSRKYAGCGFEPPSVRSHHLSNVIFSRGWVEPFETGSNGPIAALREAREATRIVGPNAPCARPV